MHHTCSAAACLSAQVSRCRTLGQAHALVVLLDAVNDKAWQHTPRQTEDALQHAAWPLQVPSVCLVVLLL